VTRPGEVSDEVYSVFSGWGALLKTGAEGRRSIAAFVVASDFIGLPLLIPHMAIHGVQAISDMELCVFDRAGLAAFVRGHPTLVDRLEAWHFLNLQQALVRSEDAGRRSAHERVAHLLLELYRRQERLGLLHGDTMMTPLRQRDLADALGLTAVHVSRVLTSLKEDGVIDGALGAIRILDRRQLRGLAGLSTDAVEFPHFWLPGVDDLARPSPVGRPSPQR
jgi:CRP-like cAMP-binding protein